MAITTSSSKHEKKRLFNVGFPLPDCTSACARPRGRRTTATDQNTKTTLYAYDDADRLLSVTDAATSRGGNCGESQGGREHDEMFHYGFTHDQGIFSRAKALQNHGV